MFSRLPDGVPGPPLRLAPAVQGGAAARAGRGGWDPQRASRIRHTRVVDFTSAYAHGFVRVAACATPTAIADPATNAATVLTEARACHEDGVAVAVFPELTLSGYAVDDLLLQGPLLDAVEEALLQLVEESRELRPVLVVGAPVRHGNRVLNVAVVIHRGRVLGVSAKS